MTWRQSLWGWRLVAVSKSNRGVVMSLFVEVAVGWVLLVGVLVWVFRPRGEVDTREECEWWNCGACGSCDRAEQRRIDFEDNKGRVVDDCDWWTCGVCPACLREERYRVEGEAIQRAYESNRKIQFHKWGCGDGECGACEPCQRRDAELSFRFGCESGVCGSCARCEAERGGRPVPWRCLNEWEKAERTRKSVYVSDRELAAQLDDADTAGELMTEAYVEAAEDAAERAGGNGVTWCKKCGQWEECG